MIRPSLLCRAALFVAGFTLVTPGASAQEKGHPAKPFLWKIEGKGLTKPSYLFGTIHLSTPEIEKLHPSAAKAFDSADTLYTEIPMDAESQVQLVPLLMRKDGKTLSQSIGAELAASVDTELKLINPQLDSTPFQPMKTWAVTFMLPVLKYQLEGGQAIDSLLTNSAKASGKKTASLETAASQFAIFDSFNEDESVIMLSETLKQLKDERAEGINSTEKLIQAYASGDEKKTVEEVNRGLELVAKGPHKELGERFIKKLLDDRNVTMTKSIEQELVKAPGQTGFFAVGTAHLVGSNTIGEQLTAKGYQIIRIQD